ncbi:MAG: iron-sulfur cluster assembly accessory protein [Alphaproteobacteria bacterium]|nr:iron-sulfur cluster assembly accessory protein [Alphaproteobacteria bacterium]
MISSSSSNPIVNYLTISDGALVEIKNLLAARSQPCEGVRVSVRTRGCSGLSYIIEYALKDKNITKFDDVVECDGVRLFIDPKVSMFLIGSQMVYKSDDLTSGFDFVNPNEKGRCGCGESFKV